LLRGPDKSCLSVMASQTEQCAVEVGAKGDLPLTRKGRVSKAEADYESDPCGSTWHGYYSRGAGNAGAD
jgi:hypothetical protein